MLKFDNIYSLFNESKYISINRKITRMILLISLSMFIISSTIMFVLTYNKEISNYEKELSIIESTTLHAITTALWNIDTPQLENLTKSILTVHGIEKVEIFERDRLVYNSSRNPQIPLGLKKLKIISYPLIKKPNNENIGEIKLYINSNVFLHETLIFVMKIIFIQFLIIIISLGLALFLFQELVINHLIKIANFLKNSSTTDQNKSQLLLDNKSKFKDEIDDVCAEINNFINMAKTDRDQILLLKNDAEEHIKLKNIFLANISHELRTPLNTIVGVFDILDDPNTDNRSMYYKMQKKASVQLLNLVNDILDLTKIEANEFRLNPVDTDIILLIENCVDILKLQTKEKRNKIILNIDSNVTRRVYLDEKRVIQVILNLITNANKFTNEGEINIHVTEKNRVLSLSVKDSGVGIPIHLQKAIFEPFRQVTSTLHINKGGIGIGLSITKKIIDEMKGSIEVESIVNSGATFTVKLPVIDPPTLSETPVLQTNIITKIKPQKNRPSLLIVDDAEENRLLMEAYLKNLDCEITFAVNGQEAIEKSIQHKFDLIFMDIQMPIMNGYDAMFEIRKYEKEFELEQTFIVALSAYQQKSDIEKAYEKGCNYYLYKPIQKQQFLDFFKTTFGY